MNLIEIKAAAGWITFMILLMKNKRKETWIMVKKMIAKKLEFVFYECVPDFKMILLYPPNLCKN